MGVDVLMCLVEIAFGLDLDQLQDDDAVEPTWLSDVHLLSNGIGFLFLSAIIGWYGFKAAQLMKQSHNQVTCQLSHFSKPLKACTAQISCQTFVSKSFDRFNYPICNISHSMLV
jgi:hypothetical protein